MSAPKRSKHEAVVKGDMESRNLRRRTAKENMSQHNFRMLEADYRALQVHFEEQGLTVAQGIRWVLKRYMKEERI